MGHRIGIFLTCGKPHVQIRANFMLSGTFSKSVILIVISFYLFHHTKEIKLSSVKTAPTHHPHPPNDLVMTHFPGGLSISTIKQENSPLKMKFIIFTLSSAF